MCKCRFLIALMLVAAFCRVAAGDAILDIRKVGGQPLDSVPAHQSVTAELWLTNLLAATSQLSAYQFNFQGGDFLTGRLQASNWIQSTAFGGLAPAWLSLDQSLDTLAGNFTVAGLSGSFSVPFIGPALPLNTPILIGTFDVVVNADAGGSVDFLLNSQSGIDDQNGALGGGGLASFGVARVTVTPEPAAALFALAGAIMLTLRRR